MSITTWGWGCVGGVISSQGFGAAGGMSIDPSQLPCVVPQITDCIDIRPEIRESSDLRPEITDTDDCG